MSHMAQRCPGRRRRRHGFDSASAWDADQRCYDACWAVFEADWRLARMPPTTLAGVAAVLRFANEIEVGGMEWPATDTVGAEGWHYQLRATMAAAIEAIIHKGMRDGRDFQISLRPPAAVSTPKKPRRSKNGTPEERAAKAAAARGEPATLVDMCPQIDRRKLRNSPLRDQIATISFAATVVGKMCTAELKGEPLSEKAAVLSLSSIPFQRSWADALQEIELKREVAGTSKIEGADFTEREFEEAVAGSANEGKLTRSQRQARAAINTYRWLAQQPGDHAVSDVLVGNIHRRIVTGCDDDHCEPGELRGGDQNVTFGRPRHRGAEGGTECARAFKRLCGAINQEFHGHDGLVQALAAHYHIGAIHPYQDGNGRTARALSSLFC